jgi:hypothetical protein
MSQGINISHLPKSLQREIVAGYVFLNRMNAHRATTGEVPSPLAAHAAAAQARHRKVVGSYLLPLLAWIFLAASAFAQVEVPRVVVAATATIMNCTGAQCLQGSATLVDKGNGRGLILTTGHLLDIGHGKITVTFPGYNPVAGELLGYDELLDVAAVEIPEPPITPLDLVDSPPGIGSTIHVLGYGSGRLAGTTGTLLEYQTQQDDRGTPFPAGAVITTSGVTTAGDSGGPMLDQYWKVCGVIMGTNRRSCTDGAASGPIRRFLQKFRPRYRPVIGARNAAAGQRPYSRVPAAAPYTGPATTPPRDTLAAGDVAAGVPPYNSQLPTPVAQSPNLPGSVAPANESGQPGWAAWLAERAALQHDHSAQMNAKSAELAELHKRMANERAELEARIRAAMASKPTPDLTLQPRVSEPNSPLSEKLEGVAETVAKNLAAKLLLSVGVPGGVVAVGVPVVWWLLKRRAKKKTQALPASSTDSARPLNE